MGVKYYKKYIESEDRYQYEERSTYITDSSMIEISQEEYETETKKQWEEYLASLPVTDEPTYEELLIENQELERENASLLYQILTGEELSDV